MKRSGIALVCLLCGLPFSPGVKAVVQDAKENPYNVIPDRNVFGLKSPPPPPTNAPPPAPAAAEVKLAGITTILSTARAIIHWKAPAKPGTPPGKDESYIFREGDTKDIIEVLEINVKAGSVKIKNGGEPMLLTFETHGAKLPNAPVPGTPGAPPSPLPGRPGGVTLGNPTTGANSGAQPNNRFGGGSPNPAPGGVNVASSGLQSIPVRQLRSVPDAPATAVQQPAMTPETQIILMEVERERTKAQVAAGELPPLPPTELTPAAESAPPAAP